LHLFVSRDHWAYDVRSLNGTTINGRFLPYPEKKRLKDGDLITIAGVAPFRFSTIEPSYIPFVERPAPKASPLPNVVWAMLIDGASRTVMPLSESEYFLAKGERGNINVLPVQSKVDGRVAKITRHTDGWPEVETLNTGDDSHLLAMLKFEDRLYLAIEIPFGVRVSEFLKDSSGSAISGAEYASKMSFCFGPTPSKARAETVHGVKLNVVKIDSDDSPQCTLGPFQIISF
jgi:hypothetical protein